MLELNPKLTNLEGSELFNIKKTEFESGIQLLESAGLALLKQAAMLGQCSSTDQLSNKLVALKSDYLNPEYGHYGQYFDRLIALLNLDNADDPLNSFDQFSRNFAISLNSQNWSVIEEHLVLPNSQEVLDLQIPLNQEFSNHFSGAEYFRAYSNTGKSSESLKTEDFAIPVLARIGNGWLSQLFSNAGKEIFSAIRSATTIHYGNKNSLSELSNRNAMREICTAAALYKLSKLSAEHKQSVLNQASELDLEIVSIDLQSNSDESVENFTIDQQFANFSELNGTLQLPCSLNSLGYILVKPKVYVFNFPTRHTAFTKGHGFSDSIHQRNKIQLDNFLEIAQIKLPSLTETEQKIATCLISQIRDLFDSLAYQDGSINPYKLQARILNLAFIVRSIPHFNCRSGKDRTSFMDAECKFLACQLQDNPLVDWSKNLTEIEQDLLFQFVKSKANSQIQILNTGVRGNKLEEISLAKGKKVTALQDRISAKNWAEFKAWQVDAGDQML